MIRLYLGACNAAFDAAGTWAWWPLIGAARVLGRIVRVQLAVAAGFTAIVKSLSDEEDWP